MREDDFKFQRYEQRNGHFCAILVDRFTNKEQAFDKPSLIKRIDNLSKAGRAYRCSARALARFPTE